MRNPREAINHKQSAFLHYLGIPCRSLLRSLEYFGVYYAKPHVYVKTLGLCALKEREETKKGEKRKRRKIIDHRDSRLVS